MKNYILQNENAVYFECGYSCDNVIFISISGDNYFITDARYEIEAKLMAKNCEVIITNDLINNQKNPTKKQNKKISFDPNDFSLFTYEKLKSELKLQFIQKPNFSKEKDLLKQIKR